MTLEQSILEAVRTLPPDKQQEVLEHAKRLEAECSAPQPRKSMKGLWSNLGISLSAEETDEARREAWKAFPRDSSGISAAFDQPRRQDSSFSSYYALVTY